MFSKFEIRKTLLGRNIIFESFSLDLNKATRSILFSEAMQNHFDKEIHSIIIKNCEDRLKEFPISINLKVVPVKINGILSKTRYQFDMWYPIDKIDD